jgi:hypothetical protein
MPAGRIARLLFKAGFCMACIAVGIISVDICNARRDPDKRLALGQDLLPSYVAGTFIRDRRPRDMYDIDAVHREEAKVVKSANLMRQGNAGPWLNPPFFAWFFEPLSKLSYRSAAAVFLAINLSLLVTAVMLLQRMLPAGTLRRTLVPLLLCTSMPFWQALCHEQNTFISLMLLALTTTLWLAGRPMSAGAIAGLLFFKPQLAVAVAMVLVVIAGRRALAGVFITVMALLIINLCTLPGTLGDFLHKLPPIVADLQNDPHYNWGRQVTLQSFWRLLIEGKTRGATPALPRALGWVCSAAVGLFLLSKVRSVVRGNADFPAAPLFAAAIVSMPLLMPYYMDYDLLLLAVPAVLFAREILGRSAAASLPPSPGTPGEGRGGGGAAAILGSTRPPPSLPRGTGGGEGKTTHVTENWLASTARLTTLDRWQLGLWAVLYFETQINPGLGVNTHYNLAVPILVALSAVVTASCRRAPIVVGQPQTSLALAA